MSRSRRRTPVTGATTAHSDKPFRVSEHRRERARVRQCLHVNPDDADPRLHRAPYGNPLDSPKDGKYRWRNREPDEIRKALRK